MTATTIMSACQTILPASSAIQQTLIEAGIDVLSGAFPALILTCPKTREKRFGAGLKQETHTIHCQYLDRWETSTRSTGQLVADCRVALEQMKANLRASHTLAGNAIRSGESIDTDVQGPIGDPGIGFPLFAASVQFDVDDFVIPG